jgi:hypothetical protein
MPFDLAVGEWWQVPDVGNSQLADVYNPSNPAGSTQIISAWNGGAIDTLRRDLIIWGGGHADYSGNEVYAFNFDPADTLGYLEWRRKSLSSTADTDDNESYADGSPTSRHTYSSLEYDPVADRLVCGLGGSLYDSGAFSNSCWSFDLTNETPSAAAPSAWTQHDDGAATGGGTGNLAYDKIAALFYNQHAQGNGGLQTFDPTQAPGSQWDVINTGDAGVVNRQRSVIAYTTPRRICFAGANNTLTVRRLDTFAWEGAETGFGVTGDTAVFSGGDTVGMTWDDGLQKLLAWDGTAAGGTDNRDVYYVNLASKVVTRVAGTGDIPTNPAANGTFGRFRNLGECGEAYYGLNILVNATNGHVYFYRSSEPPPTNVNRLRSYASPMRW